MQLAGRQRREGTAPRSPSMAPTILALPGLSPRDLDGVRAEYTRVLPAAGRLV